MKWKVCQSFSYLFCPLLMLLLFVEKVPFPILGRELESTENMSIALIPATALLALFYLDRMTSFFNNITPVDKFVKDIKDSQLFIIFRCCMLLMPIYFFVVYFTFDSDFCNAFSRSSSSQTRQPRSITFNQNGLNVDPNSRRVKHRRRVAFKTTALKTKDDPVPR